MAKNRKCLLCQTAYSYCPTCSSDRNLPKYMTTFDTENCKKIFDTLVSNTVGDLSDVDAKRALSNADLSKKHLFPTEIKHQIDGIMNTKIERSVNTQKSEQNSDKQKKQYSKNKNGDTKYNKK